MADMTQSQSGSSEIQATCTNNHSQPFSIATPAVTQIKENLSDISFLHPTHSYQQDSTTTIIEHQNHSNLSSIGIETQNTLPHIAELTATEFDDNTTSERANHSQRSLDGVDLGANKEPNDSDKATTTSKKKSKASKKNLKLDTKSKLEKSRQSARECRARKKLRYQYLEDLVSNREKAVIKLREELSMFCQMSEQMDSGTISDKDRNFLVEQTKENSK